MVMPLPLGSFMVLGGYEETAAPAGGYRLVDPRLEIVGTDAVFSALMQGPYGMDAVLSAKIANERGVLCEASSEPVLTRSRATVRIPCAEGLSSEFPLFAELIAESVPQQAEHAVRFDLWRMDDES